MKSLRVTNALLLLIAVLLAANFWMSWSGRPAMADTFLLDQCITPKLSDKPSAFVHMVQHSPTQPLQTKPR